MDRRALRDLYLEHYQRLLQVAMAVTMNRALAEDAVHDALERLLRTRRRPRDMLPYVLRAVRNAAIDIHRSRAPTRNNVDAEILRAEDESVEVSPAVLIKALAALKLDERETIWLHIYAGLSFREISEFRGRSLNTVASWYRRGIARLKNQLEVQHEIH